MSVLRQRLRLRWPLAVALAAAVLFVALACNEAGDTERTIEITFTSPTPTPEVTATPTPEPTPSPTPTPASDVCGANPDPAPVSVLQVLEPEKGAKVRNPFHVRGWGSEIGFENSGVAVALVRANGEPLPPKDVRPESRAGRIAPPGLRITDFTAPFATDVLVPGLSASTPFCLWVFLETTEEGVPKQVVQVPITVTP